MPSAISFRKLSATAALSSLYVTPNQRSCVSSTLTLHLSSRSSPPIRVGRRYYAFSGFAGTAVSKNETNPLSSTVRKAGSSSSFAGNAHIFIDT